MYFEYGFFIRPQTSGYFASNRPGGLGDDDIYTYKKQVIPVLVQEKPVTSVAPASSAVVPLRTVTVPKKGKKFIVHYDFDRSEIRPDASLTLDSLTELMHQYPRMSVSLSSHTDSRGSAQYNLTLSQRRAKAVSAYLLHKGISAQRFKARYYGKAPRFNEYKNGANYTEAEHEINRRTEIIIVLVD